MGREGLLIALSSLDIKQYLQIEQNRNLNLFERSENKLRIRFWSFPEETNSLICLLPSPHETHLRFAHCVSFYLLFGL